MNHKEHIQRKTLFKHNGQVIYSIDSDLYIAEIQLLINHVASTIEAKPEEIELCYVTIDTTTIDKSSLCVNSDGQFIFDIGNNEFGVNFMENKPIHGLRLTSDLSTEENLNKFLDNIVDKTVQDNFVFIL